MKTGDISLRPFLWLCIASIAGLCLESSAYGMAGGRGGGVVRSFGTTEPKGAYGTTDEAFFVLTCACLF